MTETRKQVTLPFAPRQWQVPLVNDRARRIVAVVHRRAGKSTGLMWRGIRRALTEKKPSPRVVHLLPYSVMWKRTGLWDQVARAAEAIPQAEILKSELAVKFANGGVYQCGGADNPDAWRGGYGDEVIADEFDDMPSGLVALVIEPMLADRGGTLIRSGTPKGNGLLRDAYERAKTTPGYSSYLLDYTKTRVLPDEAIETLRREMSEEEFAQELECSFNAPNSGSYYGALMNDAQREGRITTLDYDPALPVWTSWDLGIDDATAIWCAQITVGGQFRFIDYIEDSGAALDHYVGLLQERPYRYEMHLLPHDAAVKELGSGRSRTETLNGLGLMPNRVLRAHSVADGINAVRMVLPRAWFDAEKCAAGIKALRNYRREWNPAGETWRVNPRHDWSSHCFTGDTKVLTYNGVCRLECLPQKGDILTPCGWMPYVNPRVTRRNAQLVEVRFTDGLSVKCTPDHAFLTASGWRSAASLLTGMPIQSCSIPSRNTSMAAYTEYGRAIDTFREVARSCIAMLGRRLSDQYRRAVTFITETVTQPIMPSQILNACPLPSTCLEHGTKAPRPTERLTGISLTMPERRLLSGTDPRLAVFGTAEMPFVLRDGQNGSVSQRAVSNVVPSLTQLCGAMDLPSVSVRQRVSTPHIGYATKPKCGNVQSVSKHSLDWLGKASHRRSTVLSPVSSLVVESVRPLTEQADVWCLTVPDIECFALENGAVVHNCADSMRYMAIGTRETIAPPAPERFKDSWERAWARAGREDVQGWRVA